MGIRRPSTRILRAVREIAANVREDGFLTRDPVPRLRVLVTDEGVEVRARGRPRERIEWSALAEVTVVTTDAGPWGEDAFLLLGDGRGSGCAVPLEHADELLERLQRLPGFDNEEFIRSMSSTTNRSFVCWRRT